MYKLHRICRVCAYGKLGEESLIELFDLGIQPLANDFHNLEDEHSGFAPLKVLFCPRCTLAQLSVVVKPEILYSNYAYVTSKSQTMQNHFRALWREILKEVQVKSVVEIGSNDGDFLHFSRQNGADRIIGIDPAQNLATLAVESGIPTICDVFNSESAYSASMTTGNPDVVVARHVFAHIDDWKEFMDGISILGGKETLIVIEIPYVGDLLAKVEFDTIYHEHLSYVSLKAIEHLLSPTNFHVHKIVRFPIHGGAMAVMLRRNDCGKPEDASIESFKENITLETWKTFASKSKAKIAALKKHVHQEIANGKSICGFGASAKSTVWINSCGFTRNEIKFICDCTPYKQYTFSPGTDIPIVDEGALMREAPNICINWAWNFMDEVLKKQQGYLNLGGKIISPHLE